VTDLYYMIPALTGKLELVYEGEQEGAVNVAKHLLGKAIRRAFLDVFENPSESKTKENDANPYEKILDWFALGNSLEIPDLMSQNDYKKELERVDGLKTLVQDNSSISKNDLLPVMDMVIEALHQFSKLGKEDIDDHRSYSDMLGSMLGGMGDFEEDDFDL